jgi:hypothetical protein
MSNPMTDAREAMALLLRNNLANDVAVHDSIPDSIAPPAVFVTWSNPWLINFTWCDFTAQMQLIVVAQRIEPGGHYGTIEELVHYLVGVLRDNKIPLRDVTSPYPIVLGAIDYLAASVNIITDIGSE